VKQKSTDEFFISSKILSMNSLISIIIPAFNEEKRIERSLKYALDYTKSHSLEYEIIVVDDGSNDKTCEIVKEFSPEVRLLALNKNQGKGAAVRAGMLSAKGEIRIFTDADFSTPIYELEKIVEKINMGADICIGSRALDPNMIKEHQPFYREFMGKIFNKFVQLLLVRGIKDTQCGFKGFTGKAAELVFNQAKIDRFSFDVEILFLAKKENLKIEQVAVEWYNDERSRVNPFKDSINMFYELLKIRKLHKK